ncbi:hypothetical protein CspHIS471_0202800 [Cutaneotrichosporon sp. HIS471]|nr:hypothetical protein CspHIS471_0202800 [Cutaneotrichosporon sp. HIS471]
MDHERDDDWVSVTPPGSPKQKVIPDAEVVSLAETRLTHDETMRILEEKNSALVAENCYLKRALAEAVERMERKDAWVAIHGKTRKAKPSTSVPVGIPKDQNAHRCVNPRNQEDDFSRAEKDAKVAQETLARYLAAVDGKLPPSYASVTRTGGKRERAESEVRALVEWWSQVT